MEHPLLAHWVVVPRLRSGARYMVNAEDVEDPVEHRVWVDLKDVQAWLTLNGLVEYALAMEDIMKEARGESG